MSCQVNVVATVCDLIAVRRILFPDWNTSNVSIHAGEVEKWDDVNWGWSEAETTPSNEQERDPEDSEASSWLQECVIAMSPVGDVLMMAKDRMLVFLTRKWDNNEDGEVKAKFCVVRSEVVADDEQDFITTILCLPLASQKRSSHGRPDWTVVIVGFELGLVKMFTEDGVLLLVQCFDHDAVVSIKCRTCEPPRYGAMAEQQEEFLVLYRKSVVVVHGIGLYQTLRACRNQVAKAAATGGNSFEAPPLEYKKWAFHNHDVVSDCESVGTVSVPTFDQMMHDSMNHGRRLGLSRKMASAASLFVAAGMCPYAGFYYAVEGSTPPLVSEAVMAAAQKLSSYFTILPRSCTTDGKEEAAKNGVCHVPSEQVFLGQKPIPLPLDRFELRDFRRSGLSICTSPNRRLSAVTDDFGRVVLIDNLEGIAVRIWKGYREAQCGWIEVNEDHVAGFPHADGKGVTHRVLRPRVALFLVIYCRRRGILEVWVAQNGPRVAAFNVGKSAMLLYCNHCILGLTDVKSVLQGWAHSSRCFLLESDGCVGAVTVPFHCALSDKYSKRARDLHLLKKLIGPMKDGSPEEIASIVLDIRTASVRHQALDQLSKPGAVGGFPAIWEAMSRLAASLQEQGTGCTPVLAGADVESRHLLFRCRRLLQLLRLYEGVRQSWGAGPVAGRVDDDDDDDKPLQALSAMLHLGEQEIGQLLTKVDRFLAICGDRRSVRFDDPLASDVGFFLSCFETNVSHLPKETHAPFPPPPLSIRLVSDLPSEKSAAVARLLFQSSIRANSCPPDFLGHLTESGIDRSQLLLLLLEHWLNLDECWHEWQSLCNLHCAVIFLSSQAMELCPVIAGYNQVSPWWSVVRRRLLQCTNVAAALTAALVCRGAAVTLATSCQKGILEEAEAADASAGDPSATDASRPPSAKGNDKVSLSDWEGVDLDTEQWSLLVKQLEDLVSICTLVRCHIPRNLRSDVDRISLDPVSVTVAGCMERGRGVITELVSHWLTSLSVPTLLYVVTLSAAVDGSVNSGQEGGASAWQTNANKLKASVDEARQNFPCSLGHDVLLTNCCWEFAVQWNKDQEATEALRACVSCLRAIVGASWSKGLALLLWHTFLRKPFAATAKLVEKVGKSPKERLCRKDVGMSDSSLEKFIECCVGLLDILTRVSGSREANVAPPFRCEDPWQDTSGPAPLVDHAAAQKEPSYLLVCHHRHLAVVLHLVLVFALKGKPLSLYDTLSKSLFFGDLSSTYTFPSEGPDLVVVNSRMQFLSRAISAIVQTIPEPLPFIDRGSSPAPAVDHTATSTWVGKVLELGATWQLDCDYLRRHYVCELYSSGLDALAEEVLPSVDDCEVMGSQLVLIAGQRVHHALHASGDAFVKKKAHFSPTVTAWLETLGQDSLRCPSSPLATVASMITYILNVIPDHQAEYKMALNLLEALQQLISSEREQNGDSVESSS